MFHVPEKYRLVTGRMGSNASFGNNGAFVIPSPISEKRKLIIIASDGMDKDVISAFAEAQIVGVTLDHEIAKAVGDKLKEQGLAEYHEPGAGGGTIIQRECGSYLMCGSWSIKCELSDVMEMAIETAKEKGETLFVMVNAELVQTYEAPTYLQPAPKFTRGFSKPIDQSQLSITPVETVVEPEMWAIQNYQKAPRLNAGN